MTYYWGPQWKGAYHTAAAANYTCTDKGKDPGDTFAEKWAVVAAKMVGTAVAVAAAALFEATAVGNVIAGGGAPDGDGDDDKDEVK